MTEWNMTRWEKRESHIHSFLEQKLGSQRSIDRLRTRLSFTPGGGMGLGGSKPPGDENFVPPTHPWNKTFRWTKIWFRAHTKNLSKPTTKWHLTNVVWFRNTFCLSSLRSQTSTKTRPRYQLRTRKGRRGGKRTQAEKNADRPRD